MEDRLAWVLKRFALQAHTFQTGELRQDATIQPQAGVGYLHLLTEGSVHVMNNRQPEILINEPSVFFYFNPVHTTLTPGPNGAKLICASFEFGLNSGNPLASAISDMYLLKLSDTNALQDICVPLFFEAYEDHCGRQAMLDRLMETVLILILRDLMDNKRLNIGLFAGLSDLRLSKTLNAVHKEPGETWTIATMAAEAGMSRARFAEHFHHTVGLTPAEYLTGLRLGLAQDCLLKGKSVSQTASEVGYASASALSRVFSQRLGVSPKAWLLKVNG